MMPLKKFPWKHIYWLFVKLWYYWFFTRPAFFLDRIFHPCSVKNKVTHGICKYFCIKVNCHIFSSLSTYTIDFSYSTANNIGVHRLKQLLDWKSLNQMRGNGHLLTMVIDESLFLSSVTDIFCPIRQWSGLNRWYFGWNCKKNNNSIQCCNWIGIRPILSQSQSASLINAFGHIVALTWSIVHTASINILVISKDLWESDLRGVSLYNLQYWIGFRYILLDWYLSTPLISHCENY